MIFVQWVGDKLPEEEMSQYVGENGNAMIKTN